MMNTITTQRITRRSLLIVVFGAALASACGTAAPTTPPTTAPAAKSTAQSAAASPGAATKPATAPASPVSPSSPVPAASPAAATSPASSAAAKPAAAPAAGSRTYSVKDRDNLATIAEDLYGDPTLWRAIYLANEQVIGPNAEADLKPGTVLQIPPKP